MSYFRAENLSLHFGGLKAVDAVSFAVEKGEILSIIGPNGAGKSSIFNLISRIYRPTSGRIFFEDQDITDEPPYDIAKLGIARTFQNIELFENATVLSNLLVGRHRHSTTQLWQELLFLPSVRANEKVHRRRVEQVIEFLDLEPYRDKLISGLPYGVRKVIELARALCSEPKLILLDEPSSGLNVEETDDMSFWIRDMKSESRRHRADGRARHVARQPRLRSRHRAQLRPRAGDGLARRGAAAPRRRRRVSGGLRRWMRPRHPRPS